MSKYAGISSVTVPVTRITESNKTFILRIKQIINRRINGKCANYGYYKSAVYRMKNDMRTSLQKEG